MFEIDAQRWEALRAQRTSSGLIVEPIREDVETCLLGIDPESRLYLLIAIDEESEESLPDLQAIRVCVIQAEKTYLTVSARGHYESIFTPLVNRIITALLVQRRNAFDAVRSIIEEFRQALKSSTPEMSASEQIGLFGELWVLWRILLPTIGPRAFFLWSGPLRERHDFVGDSAHIEVKTTTGSEDRHEISRLDQLRVPPGKKLLFASIKLERTLDGAETIATKIDEILSILGQDGAVIEEFESKIASMGWTSNMRQSSSLLRFNFRDVLVFEVEGSFPRLPDDYVPPRGITGIRYTINISSRSSLADFEALAIIRGM